MIHGPWQTKNYFFDDVFKAWTWERSMGHDKQKYYGDDVFGPQSSLRHCTLVEISQQIILSAHPIQKCGTGMLLSITILISLDPGWRTLGWSWSETRWTTSSSLCTEARWTFWGRSWQTSVLLPIPWECWVRWIDQTGHEMRQEQETNQQDTVLYTLTTHIPVPYCLCTVVWFVSL